MPAHIVDKRARVHKTVLGHVVYNRAKHEFNDQDIYRITRARLKQKDDVEIGPWLANLILTLLRLVFDFVKDTEKIKKFLLSFIFKFLPAYLQIILKYEDVYYKFLESLWIWIGDILAGARPAKVEEEKEEEEEE